MPSLGGLGGSGGFGGLGGLGGPVVGGNSNVRAATKDEQVIFEGLKGEVEKEAGAEYSDFEIVGCTSQVVAGTNYWVKVRTDKDYVHFKVYEPLPYTQEAAEVVEVFTGQTENSPLSH